MKELEKIFLRFIGCSEEKIEQNEREKDYFLLEGPEPYYFMQGYEIAEKKYIEHIEKMKCCGNCKNFKKQAIQNKGNPAIIYRFTCNGLSVAPTMKCKKWELEI